MLNIPEKYLDRIPDVTLFERLLEELNEPLFLDVFAGQLLICDGTSGPIDGSVGLTLEACQQEFLNTENKLISLGFPYLDWDGRRNYGGEFIKRNYLKSLDPNFKYWSRGGELIAFVEGECEVQHVPKGYVGPEVGCIRVLRVKLNKIEHNKKPH